MVVLRGELELPSREEMLESEKLPPGTPISKAHYLLDGMYSYYDNLELAGHGKSLPQWKKMGVFLSWVEIFKNPMHYREKNLYVYDNGRVQLK